MEENVKKLISHEPHSFKFGYNIVKTSTNHKCNARVYKALASCSHLIVLLSGSGC